MIGVPDTLQSLQSLWTQAAHVANTVINLLACSMQRGRDTISLKNWSADITTAIDYAHARPKTQLNLLQTSSWGEFMLQVEISFSYKFNAKHLQILYHKEFGLLYI